MIREFHYSPSKAIDNTLFSASQFKRLSEAIAIFEDRKLELSSISFITCIKNAFISQTTCKRASALHIDFIITKTT